MQNEKFDDNISKVSSEIYPPISARLQGINSLYKGIDRDHFKISNF